MTSIVGNDQYLYKYKECAIKNQKICDNLDSSGSTYGGTWETNKPIQNFSRLRLKNNILIQIMNPIESFYTQKDDMNILVHLIDIPNKIVTGYKDDDVKKFINEDLLAKEIKRLSDL